MKKFLLIIFALYYLVLSAGIDVHLHDCVEIFVTAATETEDDHSNSCTNTAQACNLETQSSPNEVAIKSSRSTTSTISPLVMVLRSKAAWPTPLSEPDPGILTPESREPLFIFHRVFRI